MPTTEVEIGEENPGVIMTQTDEPAEIAIGEDTPLTTPMEQIFAKIKAGKKTKDAIKEVSDEDQKAKEAEAAKEAPAEGETEGPEPENKVEDDKKTKSPEPESEVKVEDPQVETKEGEAKPAEEAKETPKEDEIPEEELRVLPHDKPKTAKRIQALLKKVEQVSASEATTKKSLEEKDAKLAELEKQLSDVKSVDPATTEEIKKQLDDLAMYRRRYELDADPDLKAKFDGRIESAEKSIAGIFSKKTNGELLNKFIQEEGGWLKFSDSMRQIPMEDGSTMTAAELADAVKKNLPLSERRSIEAMELEQIQTRRDKDRFIETETKTAKEYFAKKEEEARKQAEEQARVRADASKRIDEWRKKTLEETPFLKEDPKASEDDRKYTKQIRQIFDKYMTAADLDTMLEGVMDATRYHEERRQHAKAIDKVKALEDQLKAKQAELDKFKKGSASTPKSGSLAGGGTGMVAPKGEMTFEEALAAKVAERNR